MGRRCFADSPARSSWAAVPVAGRARWGRGGGNWQGSLNMSSRAVVGAGLAGTTRSARKRTTVPTATASRPEDLVGRTFLRPGAQPAVGGGT